VDRQFQHALADIVIELRRAAKQEWDADGR